MFDFIKNIGTTEIILLLIILIVIFGPRLIRGLGRKSGEALKEVKNVKKEFTKALEDTNEPGKE